MTSIPVENELLIEIRKIANSDSIKNFCANNHILSLKLFGSILTKNFKESSDIDILIEFEPDSTPGFFKLIDLQSNLSKIFGVRKIDLRTKNDLSRYFRQEILNQAVVIYG